MARMPVQFRLNGSDRAVFVEPAETLLGTIRRGLGDFAPKFGCGQGASLHQRGQHSSARRLAHGGGHPGNVGAVDHTSIIDEASLRDER